eukprot:CAMPEP_0197180416 /NCGR_PEP_ID=MMETSP1423-20130617/5042_1 /TAXON_ID=476441 /ORGANISM="Pseudo-nitzschia heimii, Strain UNC1101" /LENGTH=1181 /DNA_ID=CAMNT_0042630493 /DNA_START=218 /DNA_END=3766 /DNA_ORIENTATION=-
MTKVGQLSCILICICVAVSLVNAQPKMSKSGFLESPTSAATLGSFPIPPTYIPHFLPRADEDIADALCTMDDLERANDSQLNFIFRELQQTNFFQNFVVDLDHKCNIFKDETKKGAPAKTTEQTTSTSQLSSSFPSLLSFMEEPHEDDEEDEFTCSGGADELDEDAVPLCSVDAGDEEVDNMFSNTFGWDHTTDMVVQDDDPPCDDEDLDDGVFSVPDTFWMDMCSNIHRGEGTKLVNLALNPERNTYYNGTHIWKAIYEENCITSEESCLEERVLYKLLSGMHTSTTLSIARNYYPPSKRNNRTDWEANPEYFMERFVDHPDYIRNLHFSYVVMLRAIKKASDYLYEYDIASGNIMEDEASHILLKRLLDTTILRSCSDVFSAFDESVMFQEDDNKSNMILRESFKGVFHNISSILDCVQCQQCKLHGKLTMLGYGTALKILFVKSPKNLILERNEVVALINTAARLSENLVEVRELTTMYWENERTKISNLEVATDVGKSASVMAGIKSPSSPLTSIPYDGLDALDITIGVISMAGRQEIISLEREKELIDLALSRHPELMIIGKHYHDDPKRFVMMSKQLGDVASNVGDTATTTYLPVKPPDAIVVGSGLAGLTAALNILDRGGTVVILEKEHLVGGNSNKASSGINGYCPHNETCNDSEEVFRNDTIRSAGAVADLDLIDVLVTKSSHAVLWLKNRVNVDLSLLAQLGGHTNKRTHRPSNGMAGAEIIYHIQKMVRSFEKTGRVKILVDTRVKNLLTAEGGDRVIGVQSESTLDGSVQEMIADNVILATGGFASDRSSGSYLDQHRPELMSFPATAGGFSTGDGIALATTLGAATRDMDKVQIHPTGWVNPKDPANPTKILAAELMRGVGGILIDHLGNRFANELGTRSYVTEQMLKHDENFSTTGKWNPSTEVPTFYLVLSSSAAEDGKKHVDLYSHKGLLVKVKGIDALSKHMKMNSGKVTKTIRKYQSAARKGFDEFGKTSFRGVFEDDLENETFYVGTVTPVLHYCMGGIKINPECSVMKEDGTIIEGLHAAGEVTGGVHGVNRLGGNSLLECTVFGTVVGQKVPIKEEGTYRLVLGEEDTRSELLDSDSQKSNDLPNIELNELAKHNMEEDLWVAIHGYVYDFTEFAHEHPAGFKSIFDLAGIDGTEAFDAVHNLGMLDDFEQDKRGIFVRT